MEDTFGLLEIGWAELHLHGGYLQWRATHGIDMHLPIYRDSIVIGLRKQILVYTLLSGLYEEVGGFLDLTILFYRDIEPYIKQHISL